MFQSSQQPIYFLHIEKTAGMSLTSYLETFFPVGAICPARIWDEISQISRNQLSKYQLFRGHFGYSLIPMLSEHPAIITVLRNPVERVLSHYQATVKTYEIERLGSPPSLEEFLADKWLSPLASNFQVRCIASSVKLPNPRPMRSTLPIEELYAMALERLETFAVVGLTERLDEAIELIAYRFGWFPATMTPRTNVTRERPVREKLDPTLLAQIIDINRHDQKLYDHAARLFERAHARMMFALLVRHYDNGSPDPLTDSIDFTFDQPIRGVGWYAREMNEAGAVYCWCGGQPEASLHFRLADETDLRLRLMVATFLKPSQLETVQIKVNGDPLKSELSVEEGQYFITAIVPKSAIQLAVEGYSQVTIHVGQRLVPASLGLGGDERSLGIAFSRVLIEPAVL